MAAPDEGYKHIEHGFEPVFDERSRILVLGSFPSVLSRANAYYYGNPQNRFWRVMATCLGMPVPPNELTAFIKQLAHLRSANDAAARALNYGAYRNVVIQNKQLLFERACDDATVLVAVNAVNEPYTFGAGELSGSFVDLLADGAPTVELSGSLELAPYEVRYLLRV